MTVRELVECLQRFPGGLRVVVNGYEEGYDDPRPEQITGNGSFALIGKEGLTGSTGFAVLRPKTDFDAAFIWCAATSKANPIDA